MITGREVQEIQERWDRGRFVEHGVPIAPGVLETLRETSEWVPYEDYMEAVLIDCAPGQTGRLLVRFPAHGAENNQLHHHPRSSRMVHVLEGAGEFVCVRDGVEIRVPLTVGDCVYIPAGTLHTFFAGPTGLVVESWHYPFIALDSPDCLAY